MRGRFGYMEEGGNGSISEEVQNTSQEEQQQQQGVGGQIAEQAGQKAAETR